jgi:hypothetical protein
MKVMERTRSRWTVVILRSLSLPLFTSGRSCLTLASCGLLSERIRSTFVESYFPRSQFFCRQVISIEGLFAAKQSGPKAQHYSSLFRLPQVRVPGGGRGTVMSFALRTLGAVMFRFEGSYSPRILSKCRPKVAKYMVNISFGEGGQRMPRPERTERVRVALWQSSFSPVAGLACRAKNQRRRRARLGRKGALSS